VLISAGEGAFNKIVNTISMANLAYDLASTFLIGAAVLIVNTAIDNCRPNDT
jgi:hypothetical protein